ncbi:hypothetical protein DFJ73DRAFT_781048 [Zopfochytrium polystomum]|nr:hypothetical protein DFJ73DRAFT_781048 [Zopfochytrium polystomum]
MGCGGGGGGNGDREAPGVHPRLQAPTAAPPATSGALRLVCRCANSAVLASASRSAARYAAADATARRSHLYCIPAGSLYIASKAALDDFVARTSTAATVAETARIFAEFDVDDHKIDKEPGWAKPYHYDPAVSVHALTVALPSDNGNSFVSLKLLTDLAALRVMDVSARSCSLLVSHGQVAFPVLRRLCIIQTDPNDTFRDGAPPLAPALRRLTLWCMELQAESATAWEAGVEAETLCLNTLDRDPLTYDSHSGVPLSNCVAQLRAVAGQSQPGAAAWPCLRELRLGALLPMWGSDDSWLPALASRCTSLAKIAYAGRPSGHWGGGDRMSAGAFDAALPTLRDAGGGLRALELERGDWVERDPELGAVLERHGVEVVVAAGASGGGGAVVTYHRAAALLGVTEGAEGCRLRLLVRLFD